MRPLDVLREANMRAKMIRYPPETPLDLLRLLNLRKRKGEKK